MKHTVSKSGAGKPTILTQDKEQEIVYCCQVLQELGFGLTKQNVAAIVSEYIAKTERENPFTNGIPGRDWWTRFLQRWPGLVQCKPQHLPKQRALAGNPTRENTRSKKPSKQMASTKKVLQPKSSNNKVKKNTKTTVLVSHDSEEDSG